jgi:hypothetical protein
MADFPPEYKIYEDYGDQDAYGRIKEEKKLIILIGKSFCQVKFE